MPSRDSYRRPLHPLTPRPMTTRMTTMSPLLSMKERMKSMTVRKLRKIDSTKWKFPSSTSQNVYFYIFISATEAVLGVNICLIFFGWLLAITSLLLIYGTFKRQSKLLIPYIFALFETVLLVILLEILPEFIDNLGVGWFLLLNFIIGKREYFGGKPCSIVSRSYLTYSR